MNSNGTDDSVSFLDSAVRGTHFNWIGNAARGVMPRIIEIRTPASLCLLTSLLTSRIQHETFRLHPRLAVVTPSMVARAADPTEVAIDKELQAAIVFHQRILDSITITTSVPKLMLKSHHQSQLKMVRAVLKDGHMVQKLTIAIIELERKIEFAKSLILHARNLEAKYTVDKKVLEEERTTFSKRTMFFEMKLDALKKK